MYAFPQLWFVNPGQNLPSHGRRYSSCAVPLPEKALIAQIRHMAKSSIQGRTLGSNRAIFNWNWRRLRRAAPTAGKRIAGHYRLHAGRHSLPARLAPSGIGRPSLLGPRAERHCRYGRRAGCRVPLPRAAPRPTSSLGRTFRPQPYQPWERFGSDTRLGDTAESPNGILADIIVVGSAPTGGSVLRSGARPGDRIFVSGELGGSAAAVVQMRTKPAKSRRRETMSGNDRR